MNIRSATRSALAIALSFAFGVYLVWTGWSGLKTGAINVPRKFSPDYAAYSTGATEHAFQIEVWVRVGGGALFVLLSIGCALALLFASPQRRNVMIVAADAAVLAHRKRISIPHWLAFVIISAFVGVLLWAAVRAT